MTTSINNSVNNSSAAAESNESKKGSRSSNPNNLNLILASEKQVKSGAMMWRVYRKAADGSESKPFYFANALKALRYAYILKKTKGGFIPAAIYDKLKAAIEAMPEEERKQAAKPSRKPATAQQEAAPAPAPVEQAEEPKPKKKRSTKRTKKEAA